MLKIPKGLKKKKKGKKSKRKGEEELFTEEELEKYRKEHQQVNAESGEGQCKENEEWSKFKDLTTGVDSILKKTQGDLDRIKSTSFFQRIPAGPKQVDSLGREVPQVPKPPAPIQETQIVHTKKEEQPQQEEKSDYAATDTESEDEDQDDIFDTSYVEAVERGEVKLAYVPDSPEEFKDDGLFDTSYVDTIIKGQETKSSKGKKTLNIGVAVEVLTGRIDNVTITTKRPSKRIIPGDLLFESEDYVPNTAAKVVEQITEQSILDTDADIPITTPIDLSVSLHTVLIKKQGAFETQKGGEEEKKYEDEEDDEFTRLAAESLENTVEPIKLEQDLTIYPVLEESWSAFEANKNNFVFAESIIEDQIDVGPFIDQISDPFDTSFADPIFSTAEVLAEAILPNDIEDEDFDPRAEEFKVKINNRRKSSVHIHLTDPSGVRESISGDCLNDKFNESSPPRDLLGGSSTDLTQLGHSPLDPLDVNQPDFSDPFDTTIVDKVAAPGKVELKLLEQELIGESIICRSPSDPDFDPRADEPKELGQRKASRPENLIVGKSVVFDIKSAQNSVLEIEPKNKSTKPLTPYYTREVSISEDVDEESEAKDFVSETLPRSQSNQDITNILNYQNKRRHSEYPSSSQGKSCSNKFDLLGSNQTEIKTKVLTPSELENTNTHISDKDPFDTSFASSTAPSKTELKLLAKEFSCDETTSNFETINNENLNLLEPSDDIFQVKALSPQPSSNNILNEDEEIDPFDTSFATNLQPGKTEIKLLESEFLN